MDQMNYVTRQFINLAKHFRKDLRKSVADLNRALDKQTEAISKGAQATQGEQRPSPEVTVLTKIPESIEVHQNADDTANERQYKDRMFFLSFVSLCALVFYATLVFLQLKALIDATNATEHAVQETRLNRQQAEKAQQAAIEQFKQDQRAWVSVKSVILTQKYSMTQKGRIQINVTNTGKTPALKAGVVKGGLGGSESAVPMKLCQPVYYMPIAPGAEDQMFIEIPPPTPAVDLYVEFVIQYWDIYDKVTPHTTTFCGHYDPASTQFPNFLNCEKWIATMD